MFSEKQLKTNVMNCLNSALKKLFKWKTVYVVLLGLICFTIYAVYSTLSDKNTLTELSNVAKSAPVNNIAELSDVPKSIASNQTNHNPHVLCVLVPFRDRFDELLEFIPHISEFLNRQSIKYHIAIINHIPNGDFRFNKGATFNAGFHIISRKFPECDYIALHDIDTLPLAEEVSYAYPGNNAAFHGIPQGHHPLYNHPDFIGGMLLMPNEIFIRLNGFGNDFWGWGWEDVHFFQRTKKYGLTINRPNIVSTDETHSLKYIHGQTKTRDVMWCSKQATPTFLLQIDDTGLSNVDFSVTSEKQLFITGFPFFVFNIVINCDFEKTPWCKPFCKDKPTVRVDDIIYEQLRGLLVWDRMRAETISKMKIPTQWEEKWKSFL